MIDLDDFDPPLLLGTDAYTERDRLLFLAGYEFVEVLAVLEHDDNAHTRMILRENESRVRVAARHHDRWITITPFDEGLDPEGLYSKLEIDARP